MAEEPRDLWGPIQLESWRATPCIQGRAANEDDVREGRAAFYMVGSSPAADITLPHCAVLQIENGKRLPVILIQAESDGNGRVLVGYRPLNGGNGVCMLWEVDLLDGPDETFN